MKKITGHIEGLYNLLADYASESSIVFSDALGISTTDINIKLRRTDIAAQVIVNSEQIKKKCDTKIIFIVNRLDEYETHEAVQSVLQSLSTLIKIKDRHKKITKIQQAYDN